MLRSDDHELNYMLARRPWAVLSLGFLICKIGVLTPQLMGLLWDLRKTIPTKHFT